MKKTYDEQPDTISGDEMTKEDPVIPVEVSKNGNKTKNKTKKRETVIDDAKKREIVKVAGKGVSKLNDHEIDMVSGLVKFLTDMSPEKKITDVEAVKAHLLLIGTLNAVIKSDPGRFKQVFQWIIDVVALNRKNGGSFKDRYVMRYLSFLNISGTEMKNYKNLLNLICVTADVKNRRLVSKKININRVLNTFKSEVAVGNLVNFYFN